MDIKSINQILPSQSQEAKEGNNLLIDFFVLLAEWDIGEKKNENISLKEEGADRSQP